MTDREQEARDLSLRACRQHRAVRATWSSRGEPIELIDAGEDKVIAVWRITGRAKLSGVDTELTYAAVYTFRDGKIAVGREYLTRDEALEAAGLSE